MLLSVLSCEERLMLRILGNVLIFSLLLSLVGAAPAAAGQNSFVEEIIGSDISDIVDNVTNFNENLVGEVTESTVDNVTNFNENLVGEVTESIIERQDDAYSRPPLVIDNNDNGMATSSAATHDTIRINEVELNPPGPDEGQEWIELYNPTEDVIDIANFEIRTSSSATFALLQDTVIGAGEVYVIELDQQILSHTAEILTLVDSAGNVIDRTPSLVDRDDDEMTWQRIPDGNNDWQFLENTRGKHNLPESNNNISTNDNIHPGPEVECLGSDCIEGMIIRIVDGGTLYARLNSTVQKIDLALIDAPSSIEERFFESSAFTRELCLGSMALIDQDDLLLASNSEDMVAVVYCSYNNLNSELLDNGYAKLDMTQCATSEFANESWVKDHGC
jgi:endonuclease YncB( thermonuclease family)